ncbi:hypothetical protein RvY_11547 [Ramazzottius varieornatus]|uniref:RING-type domain-containing protein n=1 Tax=Ramazzottius varieornatus TaxID=947166 RepID=A0A1D1VGH0_RAMVA|nr:hypothetical protein RvY_11547 [Ramazzottius varieornatus]
MKISLSNIFARIVDCVVCLSERATASFILCGLMYTCPACAETVLQSDSPKCPTCRGEIEGEGLRAYKDEVRSVV